MVYESNKNFVCSYLLKYTENKMPKQEMSLVEKEKEKMLRRLRMKSY